MYDEKNKLTDGKKVRAYSKRLVITPSTFSFVGYIAALVLNIPVLGLYFSTTATILSALPFALNIWSLKGHSLQKQSGAAGQRKLKKNLS